LLQITAERRQWKRFGAAARETAEDSVTVRHVEDIPFERIRPAKATAQEKKVTDMQVGFRESSEGLRVEVVLAPGFRGVLGSRVSEGQPRQQHRRRRSQTCR
jgi:hypothetical protein